MGLADRKVVRPVIRGKQYTITALGGITGRSVFLRLAPVLAAAFGSAAQGEAAAMSAALEKLDEETLKFVCDKFADQTIIDGVGHLAKSFDANFSANYGEMFEWLKACVTLNFGDFFGDPSTPSTDPALGAAATQAA